MVSAFIFIHSLVGGQANLKETHEAIHKIPGIKTVHFLTGPTDAIAYIEVADLEALSDSVGKIRGVKGVASTDTRVILPL